jgi:hypothetical protein
MMIRFALISIAALGLVGEAGQPSRAYSDGKPGQFPPLGPAAPALSPATRDAVEGQYRGATFSINIGIDADPDAQRLICDYLAAIDPSPRDRAEMFT